MPAGGLLRFPGIHADSPVLQEGGQEFFQGPPGRLLLQGEDLQAPIMIEGSRQPLRPSPALWVGPPAGPDQIPIPAGAVTVGMAQEPPAFHAGEAGGRQEQEPEPPPEDEQGQDVCGVHACGSGCAREDSNLQPPD